MLDQPRSSDVVFAEHLHLVLGRLTARGMDRRRYRHPEWKRYNITIKLLFSRPKYPSPPLPQPGYSEMTMDAFCFSAHKSTETNVSMRKSTRISKKDIVFIRFTSSYY